jgi:L-ribulose-5-phosphate 3-epimerase
MKKGVNAWCFPSHLRAAELLKRAKALGFSGIELNLSDRSDAILHLGSNKEEINRIAMLAKQNDLELIGISTDLLWKYPLTDNSEEIRNKGIQIVEKMIQIARMLGTSTVLVVPGIVTPEVSYDTAYSRALAAIKKLSKTAEEYKVQIAIENVWNKFLLSPLEMAGFIDQVNSPWVGAYLDIGNVVQFGYPEQWIRILSSRIFMIHVKDFKESVGNIHGFVPLLSGDISWDRVIEALKEINYKGYIIPEIPPHGYHPDWLLKLISETLDIIFKFKETNRSGE